MADDDLHGIPVAVELITVTDTTATVTWTTVYASGRRLPVAAAGRLLVADAGVPGSWRVAAVSGPAVHHHAEITDLEPRQRYCWRLDPDGPGGEFTTLQRPPGREIGRVAVLNDLHVGEQVAGLLVGHRWLPGGGFPPGNRSDDSAPHWQVAARAVIADARSRSCDLLVANGDLSDTGSTAALVHARALLDGFGVLGGQPSPHAPSYRATRGNHDGPARRHGDPFGAVFADGFDSGSSFSTTVGDGVARVRVVGLDSVGRRGLGTLGDGELAHLDAELGRGDPTVVLLHHPPGDRTGLPQLPAGSFGVRPRDAARLRALVARHGNVVAVVAGHTHRARARRATGCGDVPFVELPAVKEYPLGWTELRLFTGGVLATFRTVADAQARAWALRTRRAAFGQWGAYARGRLADRCWSLSYTDSGVTTSAARAAPALADA